ncbi:MAG: hypothetical protein PVJ86_05960 [Phycisphaerales bacterium]|jgi:hypothetical protein
MSNTELDRVKEDIEIIKDAAGLKLPFGWEDVWLNVYLIPVGVWLVIWSILPYELSRLWRILPVALLAPIFVALRIKYRRSTGRSPVKRRQYSMGLLACPILGVCGFGYMVWVVRSGHDFVFAVGGMWFFMGFMVTIFAFTERRLYYLGWAIPMMVFGVTISVWPALNVLETGVGYMLIAACSITAAIQAYQLKRRTSINVTD